MHFYSIDKLNIVHYRLYDTFNNCNLGEIFKDILVLCQSCIKVEMRENQERYISLRTLFMFMVNGTRGKKHNNIQKMIMRNTVIANNEMNNCHI